MGIDIRMEAARYYDLNPDFPDDIPFYLAQIPSPDAKILELGCGTGRVTIPISRSSGYVHGVDLSDAMVVLCREKLEKEGIPSSKVKVEKGDIILLDLGQQFDLIIAPFRVFQNLETDQQVKGLFESIRKHLAPQGKCILNVFNPNRDRETLKRE